MQIVVNFGGKSMPQEDVKMPDEEEKSGNSEQVADGKGRKGGRSRKSKVAEEAPGSEAAETKQANGDEQSEDKENKKASGSKRSRNEADAGGGKENNKEQDADKSTGKKAKASKEVAERKGATALLVPTKKAKWKEGDTIYGLNREDLYIAKVLKVRSDFKRGFPVWQYFLHYQGWSKKWDEWLNEEHTYANTDKTREIQQQMKQANKERREAEKKNKGKKGEIGKEKKPESDSNIDFHPEQVAEKAFKINIPNVLQRRLLDDLDMLEDRKLLSLPRSPCIRQLMEDFLHSKGSQASKDTALMDTIEGLEVYFDKALATMLLYDFELVQYRKLQSETPGFRPSQVYGGEHLLRLFVKLPLMFQKAEVTPAHAQAMQPRITELLKFMEKSVEKYCVGSYDSADLEYMEMVQKAHGR